MYVSTEASHTVPSPSSEGIGNGITFTGRIVDEVAVHPFASV